MQSLGLMSVSEINVYSLENQIHNQKLQSLVALAKQPTQIPCILESIRFALDPYVRRTDILRKTFRLR